MQKSAENAQKPLSGAEFEAAKERILGRFHKYYAGHLDGQKDGRVPFSFKSEHNPEISDRLKYVDKAMADFSSERHGKLAGHLKFEQGFSSDDKVFMAFSAFFCLWLFGHEDADFADPVKIGGKIPDGAAFFSFSAKPAGRLHGSSTCVRNTSRLGASVSTNVSIDARLRDDKDHLLVFNLILHEMSHSLGYLGGSSPHSEIATALVTNNFGLPLKSADCAQDGSFSFSTRMPSKIKELSGEFLVGKVLEFESYLSYEVAPLAFFRIYGERDRVLQTLRNPAPHEQALLSSHFLEDLQDGKSNAQSMAEFLSALEKCTGGGPDFLFLSGVLSQFAKISAGNDGGKADALLGLRFKLVDKMAELYKGKMGFPKGFN